MDSWTGHEVPRLPGSGVPLALYDSARQGVHPTEPAAPATMYVCGITPYDATHLGHAATMITFDLVQRMWRDAGRSRRLRAERHRHRRSAAGARRPRRRGLGGPGDARDRAVPRGHGGAADHPAGALRRRGRVDPGDRRARCELLLEDGAAYRAGRRHRRRLLRHHRRAPLRLRVEPDPGADAARSSPSAAATRDRAGKRDPLDPLLWRGARDGEPSWPGGDLGAGPPGLAHRVRGDRAEPARRRASTCRAAATTCSSRTTSAPPRTPSGSPARRLRRPLRARRHDRPGRREDVEVQGQPGLRLPAARRRGRPDGDPAGAAGRALPHRPGLDRRRCSDAAEQRLARWRAAARPRPVPTARSCSTPCAAGSPTTWTPRARWPPPTAGPRRHSPARRTDAAAPALFADTVDALLGVKL